ncbi:MAG: hypothetical protein JMN29_17420 [gamma proteobacterium endosymbiont of Lamellibrachia anaximandri]|nr:hypothetical protein [gamma proteobacterium endosymbiont of Lamellibrachia anaximandri]
MSGDVHVPFCERLRVRVPWSTLLYSKETEQLLAEADLLIAEVSRKYDITQDEISALTNMQPETTDPELIELDSKLEQLDDEMIELERRAGGF